MTEWSLYNLVYDVSRNSINKQRHIYKHTLVLRVSHLRTHTLPAGLSHIVCAVNDHRAEETNPHTSLLRNHWVIQQTHTNIDPFFAMRSMYDSHMPHLSLGPRCSHTSAYCKASKHGSVCVYNNLQPWLEGTLHWGRNPWSFSKSIIFCFSPFQVTVHPEPGLSKAEIHLFCFISTVFYGWRSQRCV